MNHVISGEEIRELLEDACDDLNRDALGGDTSHFHSYLEAFVDDMLAEAVAIVVRTTIRSRGRRMSKCVEQYFKSDDWKSYAEDGAFLLNPRSVVSAISKVMLSVLVPVFESVRRFDSSATIDSLDEMTHETMVMVTDCFRFFPLSG